VPITEKNTKEGEFLTLSLVTENNQTLAVPYDCPPASVMPTLHDATNTLQHSTLDSLSHRVAELPIYELRMSSVHRSCLDTFEPLSVF
jgi:hypothetical protein